MKAKFPLRIQKLLNFSPLPHVQSAKKAIQTLQTPKGPSLGLQKTSLLPNIQTHWGPCRLDDSPTGQRLSITKGENLI